MYTISYTLELSQAIQASFSPESSVVVLDTVTDYKEWMTIQTQPMHDHLKAHQFKFERNTQGNCRMFFKEWSTDTFWLPQSGLAILPTSQPIPCKQPCSIIPYYDPEKVRMLQTTIKKIGAYLEKAGVAVWWESWLEEAQKCNQPDQAQVIQGR